ncbi:uncharacterized protein BP01DRAFT_99005 [Aspergillus saccharolyticus JOP 1030-1]|uniref:Uncharacterized protein n=1 Tax=Aspergillus saccharolyticus JOP 1030-1 TaxID=1450539 RepID=A0A318ZTP3_9EURO|nr:hypothetical protein BP01DRAFT_99005 [Aspergillus saccharolyticus JOP 1030-1]PYH43458.1 hypothetical protein BP01DRAFT_99005 [Aspergillus saccharolyticus JOP 1030-1]
MRGKSPQSDSSCVLAVSASFGWSAVPGSSRGVQTPLSYPASGDTTGLRQPDVQGRNLGPKKQQEKGGIAEQRGDDGAFLLGANPSWIPGYSILDRHEHYPSLTDSREYRGTDWLLHVQKSGCDTPGPPSTVLGLTSVQCPTHEYHRTATTGDGPKIVSSQKPQAASIVHSFDCTLLFG